MTDRTPMQLYRKEIAYTLQPHFCKADYRPLVSFVKITGKVKLPMSKIGNLIQGIELSINRICLL